MPFLSFKYVYEKDDVSERRLVLFCADKSAQIGRSYAGILDFNVTYLGQPAYDISTIQNPIL